MSLRIKFAVAMVALAAAATIAVGWVSYVSTGRQLRHEVDSSLTSAVQRTGDRPLPVPSGRDPDGDGDLDGDYAREFTQILVQRIDSDGNITSVPRGGALPIGEEDLEVAAGEHTSSRHDVQVDGVTYRMLTVATTSGGAVQFARSLAETERLLDNIRNRTVVIVIASSLAAALLGVFIAQQVTRRLLRLADVATSVAESGDLEHEVPVDGNDETSRLGHAFNGMLASLARSKKAQQQLVQDAGHELRTPLTSLRTNVRVMQRYDELSPTSRQRLLADVESETRELTELVNELVELATDRRDTEAPATVSLAEVAERVAERFRRRSGRTITVQADHSTVLARPQQLERAVSNLVENAVKFTGDGVEVGIAAGVVAVSDRGPGLGDADPTKIFDRFYRSDSARALPGSGLGLSIVRDMAETHGGAVFARNREGGGATIGFQLPVSG
jgi:two-component system sensor histidine kinase MprB